MKIKKHFSFESKKQIWRIIISNKDKLILETRDMASKEVFFNCFDLSNGKKIFADFQFEEKSWIGIEEVIDDKIYFHKYDKPDMPNHRGIIAFNMNVQNILWINETLIFMFAKRNKVYCYKQGFEERYFYTLDNQSGELIDDFGTDYKLINSHREESEKEKNWTDYLYPENYNAAAENVKKLIENFLNGNEISGNVEFVNYNEMLMFNFHTKTDNSLYNNNFIVIDMSTGKTIFNEILNAGSPSLFTDAFFIYKNFLFLLKEKNEIKIFTLE